MFINCSVLSGLALKLSLFLTFSGTAVAKQSIYLWVVLQSVDVVLGSLQKLNFSYVHNNSH